MDENEFFRQATFQILGTLDLSKALERCLSYLSHPDPVLLAVADLFDQQFQSTVMKTSALNIQEAFL